MISVAMGVITALLYAVGPLSTSRTVKTIGAYSTVGGIAGVGLLIALPWAWMTGLPTSLDSATLGWLALIGFGNTAGIVFGGLALRVGKVGVVAPILATEGAIAATLATFLGEPLDLRTGLLLVAIAVGIVLAAIAPDPEPLDHEKPMAAIGFAVLGAIGFGSSLFATGHLSADVPTAFILLPARIVGVAFILLPLLATGRFRMTREAAPLIGLVGLTEVLALFAFTVGAANSISVTAVLASLFAPIAAVLGYVLFKERLGRLQIAATSVLAVSVVLLVFLTNNS